MDWSALGVNITTFKDNHIFGWLFKESNQEINEKKYLFELVLGMKMNFKATRTKLYSAFYDGFKTFMGENSSFFWETPSDFMRLNHALFIRRTTAKTIS